MANQIQSPVPKAVTTVSKSLTIPVDGSTTPTSSGGSPRPLTGQRWPRGKG